MTRNFVQVLIVVVEKCLALVAPLTWAGPNPGKNLHCTSDKRKFVYAAT